jgi:hypothetical protein
MSFFARQLEHVQRRRHGGDADLHAPLPLRPVHQLGERCVGMLGHVRGKRGEVAVELAPGTADTRQRRRDAIALPPRQSLVDVGHADPEQWRDLVHPPATIHRRQHLLSQVLRVGLPRNPAHRRPPPSVEKTTGQSLFVRLVNPPMIPVSPKML